MRRAVLSRAGGALNAAEKLEEMAQAGKKAAHHAERAIAKAEIHAGKQGKHIPGHNNFIPGRSELTHPNPQGLLDRHSGSGVRHGNKEVVDFGETIGTAVNEAGVRSVTKGRAMHKNLTSLLESWDAWAASADKSNDGWPSDYPRWIELMEAAAVGWNNPIQILLPSKNVGCFPRKMNGAQSTSGKIQATT